MTGSDDVLAAGNDPSSLTHMQSTHKLYLLWKRHMTACDSLSDVSIQELHDTTK